MTKMRLDFDSPEDIDLSEMIELISHDISTGRTHGNVRDGASGELKWELRETGEGVEIDRRQRLAAAMLLMAFNLPQNMMAASYSMLDAAGLCPGLTTGELPDMGPDGRRYALERARALIDEMLADPVPM